MPDQYLLLQIQKQIVEQTEKPVFAEVTLTSSHAPFITPLHDGAWNEDALMATYERSGAPERKQMYELTPENYTRSVNYSIRSVTLFLAKEYPRDGTFVILGDHQPPKPVHRIDAQALKHYSHVPFHLVTKDKAIYRRVLKSAFTKGWMPKEDKKLRNLRIVYSLLLNLFSNPAR